MVINATMLVQAFNFFIAYLLLRTLLFKPAIKAIQEEQREEEHLKTLIKEREEKLQDIEEQKKQAWQEAQEEFSNATPEVKPEYITKVDVEPVVEEKKLTDKEIEKLADDVQKAILKKVRT